MFLCSARGQIANILWVFYVSKVLDFLDTVFIVMGKKWDQLTFLHVYHHASIFSTYWVITNAAYDGDIYLTIVLNAFVHFVMYTYYMIRALGLYEPVRSALAAR
jgi:elongation of very long chain fatty acids protein 4